MTEGRVKVGIIGSQFQADIHAASFQIMPQEAEVVAVASPTPGNAAALAKRFRIPRVFTDYREMLKERDIEMVTIAAPNSLHAQMSKDIAAAGKHIVCEKPLAMTIAEGEEMVAAAKQRGVLLMYGEELFFTPKYLKAKEMADAGAFGKVYLVKQSEKHFGPHSPWFWDVNRSGGGAIARWAPTFTTTKPKPKTIRSAFSNSPMAPSGSSKTVGRVAAAWTTA